MGSSPEVAGHVPSRRSRRHPDSRQFHRRPLGQGSHRRFLRCPQSCVRRRHRPDAALDRRRRGCGGPGRGAAFPSWRETPVNTRAQLLYSSRRSSSEQFETRADRHDEHGKTLEEARASVGRGIEMRRVRVRRARADAWARSLEDIAAGIDCESSASRSACARRSPVQLPGDGAAVVPSVRDRGGNTFVLKPSEQVPLSQRRWASCSCSSAICRRASSIS